MSAPSAEAAPAAPAGTEGQQTTPAPQGGQQESKAPVSTPEAPKTQEPAQAPAQEPPADETIDAKAARLEAEVTRLRRENGKDRVTAKEKAAQEAVEGAAKTMAVALGLIDATDDAPDPAVLTQQIKAEQEKAKFAERKLAVFQNAGDGDPARLLDSTSFLASIADVDPTDAEAIKAAIKQATTDNPWLKASPTQAVGKGGTQMSGGTGEGAITQEQFDRMDYNQRAELYTKDPARYSQLSAAKHKE